MSRGGEEERRRLGCCPVDLRIAHQRYLPSPAVTRRHPPSPAVTRRHPLSPAISTATVCQLSLPTQRTNDLHHPFTPVHLPRADSVATAPPPFARAKAEALGRTPLPLAAPYAQRAA